MTKFSAAATVIVLTLCLSLMAGIAGADRSANGTQAPPFPETTNDSMAPSASASVNTDTQQYVVTAANTTAIDTEELSQYGDLGVQTGTHIELRATPNNRTAINEIDWVDNVRVAGTPQRSQVPGASDGQSLGVEEIHAADTTGEDVTVGIIDFGFDATAPEIENNVVKTQSFTMANQDPAHGTAVAEVVTRTAPDSDLHLVTAYTDIQYRQAIEYLTQQDVDIIVSSVYFSFYEDDGEHFFTTPINNADEDGILLVNAAGNFAETHWEGGFQDTDNDGFHEWNIGDERNCIPDCATTYGGSFDITLRWEETGQSSEYAIGVYNPVREEYIDTETTVNEIGSNKYVRIQGTVQQQQPIDLIVQNTHGPADDEIEVLVDDGPSGMQHTVAGSSIAAPADVPTTFSVAAYEANARRIAPYSSRGPTDDGRIGIDVTGYTNIAIENGLYGETPYVFDGTSAAAPYVGGIAALATANSGATPADGVATTLRESSDDILSPGTDPVSGVGVVNATAAVGVSTTPPAPPGGSASVVGEVIGGDISEALYQDRSGIAYQGQEIIVTGEGIVEGGDYNARTINSYTTDGGDLIVESSSQIEALETYTEDDDPEETPAYAQSDLASGEAFLVLDTDDYDAGDVFVRGEGLPVNPAKSDGTFEIVMQDLSMAFEDDDTPVTDEGGGALAELEIDSNRVGYNANVSADGDLDDQELVQIFVNTDANGATGDVGGTEYTESEIESAVLDAREYVTADGDGNLEVDETGTVDINNTDVTVEQLLNSDANPFNALVYDYGDTQPDEKIVLSDISNPEHDIDFANIDDDEYTVTVDVADTTAAASATVQTAVTENPQADDAVFNVSIIETNSPVEEGETLRVTAIIKNTGDVSGTQTINLDMGSLGSDSISVSVDSGVTKTETLTLSTSTGDAGSYPATVSSDNDSASQSITVQEVDDGADPQLDTRDPETVNAHPGETVEITAEYSSDDNKIELYDEMIVTGQEIAEITDATSEKTQGSVSDDKNSASALYISPVNRDTFSVSVKISEDASDGETVELSGTIIGGTGETNAGTTTITIQQGPTLADYANESGIVETDGLLDAIAAWRNDDVGVDLLLDAIDAWRSGNSIE